MAANTLNGLNLAFPIYNADETPFHNLVLHKATVESVVMSLGDKITGDVYYKNNALNVTMNEYIEYKGVKYVLVNPPTILREGMVKDNGELKGMTKYSFEFYHPMYQLGNFPFTDVATKPGEEKYLSQNKSFSWIGKPQDYIDKLNKNLQGTVWYVRKSDRFPVEKDDELSDVQQFDNISVAEAIKRGYEIWDTPYIVNQLPDNDPLYAQGKRFVVEYGLPSNEIYENESARQLGTPFVFKMGQGVGLKNNSRTPRNNKIITRIAGYGSESNIPYGYPQIRWYGNPNWEYTINSNSAYPNSYPIYDGIVGGAVVKLIKHPFTRTHLMPSVYSESVFNKVSPYLSDGSTNPNYDPDVELKDYYDAVSSEEYPYINEINLQTPCYEIHEFEDIKPELGEEYIIDAQPINDSDKSVADEWDDTIDSDGNYNQGYFQITLPILSFDLYACAAITQEMQINMRGGACIGCTFTVQVDWDNYKANFYNQDGEFDPEGEHRDYEKYPDSRQRSITVIVQKEYSTFGTIMPNVFQQPKNGDQFVFLGISMPSSYIEQAEQRLDDEMRSYMLENNTYHYEYPLKFDEYFLATHQYILEQLKPNSIVRFDFAGQELELFVKQTTIKYGESPLPQYNITLTDNIEIVLNQIGQVADDVEKLSSLVAILRQSYGRNVWVELSKKLSKVSDDTAQGFIRFMKGLQVGEDFVSGLLGEGGVFRKDADGTTYLEADKMYVRMKAYFDTVEIRKFLHSGGNRIASVAGAKCVRVVPYAVYGGRTVALSDDYRYHWITVDPDTGEETQHQSAQYSDNPNATNHVEYYRCYFRGSDGDDAVTNDFIVGDQAYCHITNGDTQALQQHQYWRLVLDKSNSTDADGMHYIDLSNHTEDTLVIEDTEYKHAGFQTGSDVPSAQDDIVQLGNIADKTRQGAIIEYVSGEDAPSYQIYQGIDDFNLNGKNYVGIGYNSSTGRAYMNVYGDAYIGDRNGSTYMQYHIVNVPVVDPETGEQIVDEETGEPIYRQEPRLDIKARINVQSTVSGGQDGDQSLEEYINSRSVSKETIMKLIGDDLQAIQNQIDGAIETWFYNGAPSTNTLPESEWKATDTEAGNNNERLKHLGDLYYDNKTGRAYRYVNTGTEQAPVFSWTEISDSAVVEALKKAQDAQSTADGKRRIFVVQPTPPYDKGDLWVNATFDNGNIKYDNDILKCVTAKDKNGSFAIGDWTLASKYTDDAKFDGYINQILNGNGASGDSAIVANAIKVIKNALNEATVIDGGLVLTSLINLRSNSKTWAGVSGQYDEKEETQGGAKGHGIAAWYGGGMADWEKYKESHPTATITDAYAKSLFRFDGSGYLAGGNITWDASGRVAIKDITTLIGNSDTDILNGLTIFNKAFHFNTQQGDDVTVLSINPQAGFTNLSITSGGVLYPVATQQWVSDNYLSKAFFSRLFQAHNGATDVNPNDTTTAITDIEAMFGFWTEQYISALGKNDSSSDVVLNEPLQSINNGVYGTKAAGTAIVWDGSKWVYGKTGGEGTVTAVKVGTTTYQPTNGVVSLPAYPTSLAWGNITGKPTTIGGYGITDAKIVDGTITLGSNTITPLTDAKLKSGYEWWGQKLDASGKVNGDITVTKTGNNIAVKLVGSDYNIGLHLGSGGTNRGIYEFSPANKWLIYFNASNTILNHGNVGIGTASPYTNLDVNGGVKANKFYFYKPNAGNDTNAIYLVYDSANGGVHLVGAGLYSDSYVSALGLSDSGSSSVFDEAAMWTALGGSIDNQQITSSHLTNALAPYALISQIPTSLKNPYKLTITLNGTATEYDGSEARSLTINTGLDQQALTTYLASKILTIKNGTATLGTWNPTAAGTIDIASAMSGYVTALGTNGDYLTWTKNGTANNLTVPYATHATRLAQSNLANDGDLSQFTHATDLIYAAKGGGNTVTDKPTGVDAFGVLSFKTAIGYNGQMLLDAGGALYVRSSNSLPGVAWKKILDSSNYTDYVYSKGQVDTSLSSLVANGTANRLAYYTAQRSIGQTGNILLMPNTPNSKSAYMNGLRIWGACYGNSASALISGTEGILSYGDGGPQIIFSYGPTDGSQSGAILYTNNDSCGTGASFHFLSNQSDWNVNSKRFVARSSVTIGQNTPNTNYALYTSGNAYFTSRIYLASGVYLEYNGNGGVHLVGAGFYSDSYVSALGLSDSSNPAFDESAMWQALGTTIIEKQISSTYLTNALAPYALKTDIPSLKTLSWSYGSVTAASGNSYNGSTARSFVIPKNTSHLTNDSGFITSSALGAYVPLAGGVMTGVLTTPKIRVNTLHNNGNTNGGIYYYNGTKDYLLIGQGSSNLWIGANETAGTHHTGSTYISSGDGETYISRLVNGVRSNYKVLDTGNTYTSGGKGYINGSEITTVSGYAGYTQNLRSISMAAGDDYDTLSGYTSTRGSFVALNWLDDTKTANITLDGKTNRYIALLSFGYGNRTIQFMGFGYSDTLKYRHVYIDANSNYALSPWKTIAFTDSTVEGAKKLQNWYSSRPTSANVEFGDGALRQFKATSSMTTGKPGNDAHILHLAWDNTGGYDAEVAVINSGAGIQYRGQSAHTWTAWKTLLDTSNYVTYAKPRISVAIKNLSAVGWYRVVGVKQYGMSFLLTLYGNFNNQSSATPVTFLISHGYNNDSIVQVGGCADTGQVSQVRIVRYGSGQIYVDVYYALSVSNGVGAEITPLDGKGTQGSSCFVVMDFASVSATPASGQTIVDSRYISKSGIAGLYIPAMDGYKQGPDFFGRSSVGFLMSNQAVNGDTSYKNWMYMDNYYGTDIGGTTAIGVSRSSGRMFVMRSDANRSSWNTLREVVVADTTGNVGIGYGNTAASYKLDVNGAARVKDLWIGGIHITEDTVNGGIHIANGGMSANTYVSALGVGQESGGTQGLDIEAMWTELGTPNSSRQIDSTHISVALNDYATQNWVTSTALSGYATQNWVNQQGFIKNAGVTSVALSVPTGLSVNSSASATITSSGTFAIIFASGYSIPTTDKQASWDAKQDAISDIATIRSNATNGEVAYEWINTSRTKNTVLAAPNGSSGKATFRTLVSDDIPNLAASKITSGTFSVDRIPVLTASKIPDLSNTYATPSSVATQMQSYAYISGNVIHIGDNSITPLTSHQSVDGTFWGQPWSNHGTVSGNIEAGNSGGYIGGFDHIDLNTHASLYGYGGYIDFYYNGAPAHTSRVVESSSGLLTVNGVLDVYSNQYAELRSDKTLYIGSIPVTYDSANNAVRFGGTIYATGGVSSLGISGTEPAVTQSLVPDTDGGYSLGSRTGSVANPSEWVGWNGLYLSASNNSTRGWLYVDSDGLNVGTTGDIYVVSSVNMEDSLDVSGELSGGIGYFSTRMGIGGSSTSYRLYVYNNSTNYALYVGGSSTSYGTGYFTGAVSVGSLTNRSDIRLKDVLGNIDPDIETIARAPIFRYRWKDGGIDGLTHVGTSAQYWRATSIGEVVTADHEGLLGIDSATAALIAAITTARKVLTHEEEIAVLKRRIGELESEIETLKAA